MLHRRVTRRQRLKTWIQHTLSKKYVIRAYFTQDTGQETCLDVDEDLYVYRTWWFAEMARRSFEENWSKPMLYFGLGKYVRYIIETIPHVACGGGGRCANPMLRTR